MHAYMVEINLAHSRERKRERERQREKERGRKREGGRGRERERERGSGAHMRLDAMVPPTLPLPHTPYTAPAEFTFFGDPCQVSHAAAR